jgi:hypothetical protein
MSDHKPSPFDVDWPRDPLASGRHALGLFASRSLAHRAKGDGGALAGAVPVMLGVAALTAWLAGRSTWLALPAHDLEVAARERVFWLCAALCFTLGFSVFESVYRAKEHRLLLSLPTHPLAWFERILRRTVLLHTPLGACAAAFVAPLAERSWSLGAASVTAIFITWFLALPATLAIHTLTAGSLLQGDSPLKKWMASGIAASEAAFVFYAPALAFAVCLVGSFALQLGLRLWLDTGSPAPFLGTALLLSVATAGALLRARQAFERSFSAALPRFWDSEGVGPFRETHLPMAPWTVRLASLLPNAATRALFVRDLVQLRRRHRMDALGVVAYAVLAGVALSDTGSAASADVLRWMVVAGAALFCPIHRLFGAELESEWAMQTLPLAPRDVFRAKLLAAAPSQLLAIAAVALASLVTGGGIAATVGFAAAAIGVAAAVAAVVAQLRARNPKGGGVIDLAVRTAVVALAVTIP